MGYTLDVTEGLQGVSGVISMVASRSPGVTSETPSASWELFLSLDPALQTAAFCSSEGPEKNAQDDPIVKTVLEE